MKTKIVNCLFVLMTACLFVNCTDEPKPDPKVHYINTDFTIVDKFETAEGPKKRVHFHKAFLLRGIKDTTLMTEYTGLRSPYMPDSVYYNHKVGDTLHFDFVCKKRFFRIHN